MTLPTFIGIGAQRAATTWVYECLREHPQIFMAREKEIHFFNEHFEKGVSWYENHFQDAANFTSIGEITPNYLNNPAAIPRMAKLLPQAKLFVILREPVSRAYSAYKLMHEQFRGMTFQQACQCSDYLLRLSCYAEDMKRVLAHYDRGQVGIYLYEDVKQHPYEMLADLYAWVGADPGYRPKSIEQVYNPVILPRFQHAMKRAGLSAVIRVLKETTLVSWTKKCIAGRRYQHVSVANKLPDEKEADPIGTDYRQQLREFFREDILKTQDIIGRDLGCWLS